MKRVDSCPSIVETVSFFDTDGLLEDAESMQSGFQADLAAPAVPPEGCLESVPEDRTGVFPPQTAAAGPAAVKPAPGKTKSGKVRSHAKALTPEERKQRRLESNRLAAKRAYYRRLDKVNTMQQENKALSDTNKELTSRAMFYEALLRRLGVDPERAYRSATAEGGGGGGGGGMPPGAGQHPHQHPHPHPGMPPPKGLSAGGPGGGGVVQPRMTLTDHMQKVSLRPEDSHIGTRSPGSAPMVMAHHAMAAGQAAGGGHAASMGHLDLDDPTLLDGLPVGDLSLPPNLGGGLGLRGGPRDLGLQPSWHGQQKQQQPQPPPPPSQPPQQLLPVATGKPVGRADMDGLGGGGGYPQGGGRGGWGKGGQPMMMPPPAMMQQQPPPQGAGGRGGMAMDRLGDADLDWDAALSVDGIGGEADFGWGEGPR